jgi:CDP-6-deoxy-D-xylo-4-hexulose-3-dehydrase
VALSCLTSPKLRDRRLRAGDEVITVAAGFPTTVNPILQNNLVPVFVDVHLPTYNIDVAQLEAARSEKTRAIMVAHTLGNPFDLDAVVDFARRHGLWLVEDCCDAVGSTYGGRPVGSFGDLATVSFYPAHHLTMGEGGAVLTDRPLLKKLAESFRDWGRDCWCGPGRRQHLRQALRLVARRAAARLRPQVHLLAYRLQPEADRHAGGRRGRAARQARRLHRARRRNFARLRAALEDLQEFFLLPEATPGSDPSWFGFPISVRPEAPFSRRDVVRFLDERKVATRQIFAGNLLRQPAYSDIPHRAIGDLSRSDFVMNQAFWVGVYPGLSDAMIDYVAETFRDGCRALGQRRAAG